MISISFHGAVTTVTGSKTIITIDNNKYLIDCGMFQGRKQLRQRNWIDPPFNPEEIKAVILTHAHIDHIGYLPKLIQQGFKGPVYATAPTIELAKLLLLDSAYIQQEDAEYRNRKKATKHKKALPLFTTEDAKKTYDRFVPVKFRRWVSLGDDFQFQYHPVGHILGAGSVEAKMTDNNESRTILFSGDIGRYSVPLIKDPISPPMTDYLVCESTYGGEVHYHFLQLQFS